MVNQKQSFGAGAWICALAFGLAFVTVTVLIYQELKTVDASLGHSKLSRLNSLSRAPAVVLLGTSRVNRNLSPDELSEGFQIETGKSLSFFNFGLDGLSWSEALFWMKEVRANANGKQSQIWIIEENLSHWPLDFRGGRGAASPLSLPLHPFLTGLAILKFYRPLESPGEYWHALTYHIRTTLDHSTNRGRLARWIEAQSSKTESGLPCQMTEAGYCPFNHVFSKVKPGRHHEMLMAASPMAKGLFPSRIKGALLQELRDQAIHVVTLNLTKELRDSGLPPSDYWDEEHLFEAGARIFSRALGRRLARAIQENGEDH